MIKQNIWLIGTGLMAIEYSKVLNYLNCDYLTIGRGEINSNNFFIETGKKPVIGGLQGFLNTNPPLPDAVIVSVGIETLSEVTLLLLQYGAKYILAEKPGVGFYEEINPICDIAASINSTVLLAYNRRFYASVLKAKELIEKDGGVTSFHFEFTEWSHSIEKLNKSKIEFENWFLGNSSHVIDTAFFLCGIPIKMSCFRSGELVWHPSGAIYCGAGISENNALFSYIANWQAPGRWNLEIMTKKHRYIFKPLEKLQIMTIGSVATEFYPEINYELDTKFKPGILLQTRSFLEKELTNFCDVYLQRKMIYDVYTKMAYL